MAGLVPAIHVGVRNAGSKICADGCERDRPSSETAAPCRDVDARHKAGHDEDRVDQPRNLIAYEFSRR
jgi:hypothetical protein